MISQLDVAVGLFSALCLGVVLFYLHRVIGEVEDLKRILHARPEVGEKPQLVAQYLTEMNARPEGSPRRKSYVKRLRALGTKI